MNSKFPSDPYLDYISTSHPQYLKEIFDAFLKAISDKKPFYKNLENPLLVFSNVPEDVLLATSKILEKEIYEAGILRHPNCPKTLVNEGLADLRMGKFSYVVHNPKLTMEQLSEIVEKGDPIAAGWAVAYLLEDSDSHEVDNFVRSEVKKEIEKRSFVLHHVLKTGKLTEKTIRFVIEKHGKEKTGHYIDSSIGSLIAENQNLDSNSRKFLSEMGFLKEKDGVSQEFSPAIDKGFHDYKFYLTSYLFPLAISSTLPKVSDQVLDILNIAGHPLQLANPRTSLCEVDLTEENLFQLIRSEYLHRMFWTELNGVDGFSLNYHNSYRVEDLFIDHPILSREFDSVDYEDGWKVGGVLPGYEDRTWVDIDRYLIFEQAVRVITGHGGETIDDFYLNYESLQDAYPVFLGFMHDFDCEIDFKETYGVTATEKSEEVISSAAAEIADSEDEDVDVFFARNFKENLSWKKLPDNKKRRIIELLLMGLESNSTFLAKNAEHFLGCAALHPDTPANLLNLLSESGNSLVRDTLMRRTKK